jgi:acyl-CoA oxidase
MIAEKQDFSMLKPIHTILSGFKALFTNEAYEGVKIVRECCGGTGFANFSSIPVVIDAISSFVTLEGDTVVMNMQTA